VVSTTPSALLNPRSKLFSFDGIDEPVNPGWVSSDGAYLRAEIHIIDVYFFSHSHPALIFHLTIRPFPNYYRFTRPTVEDGRRNVGLTVLCPGRRLRSCSSARRRATKATVAREETEDFTLNSVESLHYRG